jgi:Putative Ig domain
MTIKSDLTARRNFQTAFPALILLFLMGLVVSNSCCAGVTSAGTPGASAGHDQSPAITSTTLPAGTLQVAYNAALSATGGTAPYSWRLTSGQLPTGLGLSPSGAVVGMPTHVGTSLFTVKVKDSSSPPKQAAESLSISISSGSSPVQITTNSLASGQVGSAYSVVIAASGGITPYSWSQTGGTLPPGLGLDASSGQISGTPTQSGTFPITVQVKDSSSPAQTASQGFSIVVAAAGTQVSITTSSLPSGQKNSAYSATLAASGGTTPYTWSISAGALPAGLSLGAGNGVISGTPTASGSFSFTAKVTDSTSPTKQTATKSFTVTIASGGSTPVTITTSSVPNGQVGAAYSTTLTANGGTMPYTWSISAGALPAGLSLGAGSGVISGTPKASGSSSFTVQVKDVANSTATKSLSILIAAAGSQPLQITNSSLAAGQTGQPYSVTLQATGGTPGYTWSIAAGQLPTGFTLGAASGQISGTAGATGQFGFTVNVTDSASPPNTAKATFSITISSSGLDQYGGLTAKPSPNGATGFFRVEKFGQRWMFVTPAGNAFWMFSVYHGLPAFLDPNVIQNKYGGDQDLWATQRNRRFQSWGFNTLGEYTSSLGLPVGVYGAVGGNSVPLPFIMLLNGAVDGMDNPSFLGLPESIKNILAGVPGTAYNSYRGPLVDVYDPKYAQAQQAEVGYWSGVVTGGFADKPWVVGITTDDGDDLFGFKSGAGAPLNAYPHIGYLVAVADFQYTAAQNPTGKNWIDAKLYSKYAWITFLQQKYSDINALNVAWRTNGFYTSFGDAGGYGTGTGVIDEDGRHVAWMGTMIYPYVNTGASAGVQVDLDTFLYQFANTYAQINLSAIRAVDTNHLIFGPASLNNYGAMSRKQILQGLSDGGIQVFQYNYNPNFGGVADLAGSMAQNNQSYDLVGKPAFIWYSVTAQADSDMSAIPPGYAQPNLPTQAQRGAQYQNVDIPNFLNAQGSNGDYYVIGFDWWELVDNPGEGINWGLTTRLDNAYDGKEDVIAPGVDQWGFTAGGETANYGDFLSSVQAANANAMQTLLNTLP